MFKHKAPLELIAGRRHRPHDLFGGQDVEGYLGELERAVALQLDELGAAGPLRGLRASRDASAIASVSAAGPAREAASAAYLDRLIPLLDRLDTAESFVNPARCSS